MANLPSSYGRGWWADGAANATPFILQGLSSVCNLLISWYLVRQIGVSGFGFFTVYFTFAVAFVTLIGALIVQPLNTLASRHFPRRKAQFVVTATTLNMLINVALVIVWGGLLMGLIAFGITTDHLIAIGVLSLSMNIGEFQRRIAFFNRRVVPVLRYDAVRYLSVVLLFSALRYAEVEASALAYTAAYSGSYLIASLLVAPARSEPGGKLENSVVHKALARRLLRSGRWLVATNFMRLVNAQFVVFVAFFALGAYETGLIRIAQTIVGVINPLSQGMEHVLPVRLGNRIREIGKPSALKEFRRLSAFLLLGFAVLLLSISVFSPLILRAFGVASDANAIFLVAGFALGYLLNVLLTFVLFEVRAREMVELSSIALFGSATLAVVIAFPATVFLELGGVILTICLTQALGICLLIAMAWRKVGALDSNRVTQLSYGNLPTEKD